MDTEGGVSLQVIPDLSFYDCFIQSQMELFWLFKNLFMTQHGHDEHLLLLLHIPSDQILLAQGKSEC